MRAATAIARVPGKVLTATEAAPLPRAREFGAVLMSPDGRRGAFNVRWLRHLTAVRRLAGRLPIPWSVWGYSNPCGMSVILPEGLAMPDADLLEAFALMRS